MNAERIVAFAEELARVAAGGGGVAALVAEAARASGCAIVAEDVRWRPLAAGGEGATAHGARAVVEGGAAGRAVRIAAGDAHLGWLCAFPPDGDAGALDQLLRIAAAAIGVELARARDAAGGGRRKQFWERLIARGYHDAGAVRDDAAARGIAIATAYVAVALEIESAEIALATARDELRTIALRTFRSGEADLGYLERGTALLLFVPAARALDAGNARTAAALLPKTVAKTRPALRFSGGTGTVEAPLGLHRSADAAEAAMTIGRRILGPGRVAAYEELGAYPLLYEGADLRRLQTFASGVLEPLRAYDRKHQTELERTLRLFFTVGQNVKLAAAQLDVHRHTVVYRLRQIGEICGRSIEDPHDQLTLRMAVAIDALHFS